MVATDGQIEPHHLPGVGHQPPARNQVPPFAVQIDEAQIDEGIDDQRPHRGEMPVPRPRQPPPERQPARDLVSLERVAAERLALARKRRVRVEDAKPAADHDGQRQRVHPVGDPHHQVMAPGRLARHAHGHLPI